MVENAGNVIRQRQRIQQQQARHEADLKLQRQQKLELKWQVSEQTLSLQERESQISGRQVDRHGWGATAGEPRQKLCGWPSWR